jgi:hypothetical protein
MVRFWDGNIGHPIANCDLACKTGSQAIANARLIAAAPELYEALDYLARYHKSGGNEGDPDEAERKAFAALTKARGEAL